MSELTPAAKWRVNGEPDPHGERFDCERHELCKGDYTDDELANEVFLHNHDIVILQAAKDRIRWLSRRDEKHLQKVAELEQQLKTARLDAVRGVIRGINVNKWNSGAAEHYTATALEVWKVGFQDCRLAMIEYANNLEGK